MKISDVKNVGKPSSVKKKSAVSDDAVGFESLLDQTSEAAGTTPAKPTGGVLLSNINILAAEQLTPAQEKERQIKRGDDLLDEMEQLKISLLNGRLSAEQAKRMTQAVKNERGDAIDDPALNEIIDAIELRCEVELAKLERATSN